MPSSGGSSGGSLPALARNVGQAEFDFNNESRTGGTLSKVTLAFSDGDATLVDLTDPTYPLLITSGLYAITVTAVRSSDSAQPWLVRLVMDDNYYSIPTDTSAPSATGANSLSVSATWWCDTADPFFVAVASFDSPPGLFSGRVFVQLIR